MGELSAMQAFGNELIPRERFTSADFVALEYERLWPRVWQAACRLEEIPNPGDFMEYSIGDHSAFVTRTGTGEVRAFHNSCIHRGTRLASGCGSFRGEIRCPFHGWRFDGVSGSCVEVPYDEIDFIPKRAKTRSYPAIERNQMIWVWHHLQDGEPFYDVPEIAEFSDPDWLPIVVRTYEIRTCAQEMAENNVDYSHFKFVHGSPAVPEHSFYTDGVYKRAANEDETFVGGVTETGPPGVSSAA